MLCCALVDNHGCCALVHMLLRIGSSAVAHWFTCCCALVGHMLLRSGEALFQVITLRLGVDCDGFNVPRLPRARGMLADYAQQGGNRERVRQNKGVDRQTPRLCARCAVLVFAHTAESSMGNLPNEPRGQIGGAVRRAIADFADLGS